MTETPLQHWRKRSPEFDESKVGITFVDVLFALVMERVLSPFASNPLPSWPESLQLMLAGTITVTSWIGYHSSWNRPRWFIRFPNLPLWQFLIDVLLVIDYWFLASRYDFAGGGKSSSPLPASLMILAAFVLYLLWDYTVYFIRRDDRYKQWTMSNDLPSRRGVTIVFLCMSFAVAVGVAASGAQGQAQSIAVMIVLLLLVVLYRFAKDWFYNPPTEKRTSGAVRMEEDERTITITVTKGS